MATHVTSESGKSIKPVVLGRSAVSGRFVLAPKGAKKSKVTDKQIKAAVKSVLAAKR